MPSPYDNEIVFGIDPDCVVSCALRTKARTGQAGPRHAVRVEPPQVTIIGDTCDYHEAQFVRRVRRGLVSQGREEVSIKRIIPVGYMR